MIAEQDLKPCPFCGAESKFIEYDTGDDKWTENDYMVCCVGAGMHMLDHVGSKLELLEVWNTRAGEEQTRKEARKEAADMACEVCKQCHVYADKLKDEAFSTCVIRAAILGDSATASTDAEKLAVAVEALEEISHTENSIASDFRNYIICLEISRKALKEIQK